MISVRNLRYSYPESTVPALQDISFDITSGEFILLIGASGSGKTTLLEAIAGVVHNHGGIIRGQILIEDKDVVRDPNAKRGIVGLVLQDPEPQLTSLTVEDEIRFGPENLCLQRAEIANRLEWAIDRCRLDAVRHNYVYALSGGQKQRVVIAAGLAMQPNVLLMDGPTTNLDPEGAREVLAVIHELRQAGLVDTVILSANKVDALLPLATRIVVLDHGKVVLDGTPDEIIGHQMDRLDELGLFVPEIGRVFVRTNGLHRPKRIPLSVLGLITELKGRSMPRPVIATGRTADKPSVVELKNVWFGYSPEKPVLRGITLDIRKGEFLAIAGQNGSGKSTLMSLIAGLKKPQKGKISVDGMNIKDMMPGTVGFVFQNPDHQFVTASVEEELAFGLKKLGCPEGEIRRQVDEILDLFGLSHVRKSQPYFLSMGEKRLLSVATMVIMQPSVLILDEPTTGLDARLTGKLMSILGKLVIDQGMTLIQVSHDMEQIAEHCERVIVIDSGIVILDGTPRALFADQSVLQSAKLEAPPVAQLSQQLWPGQDNLPITIAEFLGGNV